MLIDHRDLRLFLGSLFCSIDLCVLEPEFLTVHVLYQRCKIIVSLTLVYLLLSQAGQSKLKEIKIAKLIYYI